MEGGGGDVLDAAFEFSSSLRIALLLKKEKGRRERRRKGRTGKEKKKEKKRKRKTRISKCISTCENIDSRLFITNEPITIINLPSITTYNPHLPFCFTTPQKHPTTPPQPPPPATPPSTHSTTPTSPPTPSPSPPLPLPPPQEAAPHWSPA